jgi:hypothetical protein
MASFRNVIAQLGRHFKQPPPNRLLSQSAETAAPLSADFSWNASLVGQTRDGENHNSCRQSDLVRHQVSTRFESVL